MVLIRCHIHNGKNRDGIASTTSQRWLVGQRAPSTIFHMSKLKNINGLQVFATVFEDMVHDIWDKSDELGLNVPAGGHTLHPYNLKKRRRNTCFLPNVPFGRKITIRMLTPKKSS